MIFIRRERVKKNNAVFEFASLSDIIRHGQEGALGLCVVIVWVMVGSC